MISDYAPLLNKRGLRVIHIHKLLSKGSYNGKRIREIIASYPDMVTGNKYSLRTFNDDIRYMREMLNAPINSTSTGIYSYARRFSMFGKVELLDYDVEVLTNLSSAASKYKDLPFFSDLDHLIQKRLKLSHKDKHVVGFEGAPIPYGGIEHFRDIMFSILDRCELTIEYTPFGSKAFQTRVFPHYIKEYGHRWYLLAWNPEIHDYRIYALDRLSIIHQSEENAFLPREDFDPEKRWEHAVGIIVLDEKPTKFSFEVKDGDVHKNIPFLQSMPIHASQKLTAPKGKGKYWKLELLVYPTIELFREIRKLGQNNVRNIQPKKYHKDIWEE